MNNTTGNNTIRESKTSDPPEKIIEIPDIKFPYTLDQNKTSGISGWVCPRCNNVYSPFIKGCCNCNKSEYPVTPPTWY